MAAYRTSFVGGSTTGTGDRTCSATPAVGDLFVVFCFVSTNTNDTPTCSDGGAGGTYTRIDVANVVIATVNHRLSIFVRDTIFTGTAPVTITVATGSNTSGAIHCHAYSSMTRTGASAIRSKGLQNNQAAGTAAPALNQSALTGNVTAVAQGSADTTTTPPTNWTERQDTNFATPTIALETATRDSGFTGTTITFGAASSTTFCSYALELDGSAAPITGVAAITLDGIVLATAGTVVVDGDLAITLDAIGLATAGTVVVDGDVAITLGGVSLLAEGTVSGGDTPITGTAAITLDSINLATAGTVVVDGDASITLDLIGLATAGTVVIDGDAAITLGGVGLSASGSVVVAGGVAITLDSIGLSSAGTVGDPTITGTAAITLDSVGLTGAGTVVVSGAAAITLGSMGLSSAGDLLVVGGLANTLDSIGLTASGTVGSSGPITGVAAIALDSVGFASAGDVVVSGIAAITFGGILLLAEGDDGVATFRGYRRRRKFGWSAYPAKNRSLRA